MAPLFPHWFHLLVVLAGPPILTLEASPSFGAVSFHMLKRPLTLPSATLTLFR